MLIIWNFTYLHRQWTLNVTVLLLRKYIYFFHLSWFWSNLANKRNPKSSYLKSILSVLQNRFLTSLCNHCNASCFLPDSCSALTDRCGYQATALVAVSVWGWSGWRLLLNVMLSRSPIGHNSLTSDMIRRERVTQHLCVSLSVICLGGGVYAAEQT